MSAVIALLLIQNLRMVYHLTELVVFSTGTSTNHDQRAASPGRAIDRSSQGRYLPVSWQLHEPLKPGSCGYNSPRGTHEDIDQAMTPVMPGVPERVGALVLIIGLFWRPCRHRTANPPRVRCYTASPSGCMYRVAVRNRGSGFGVTDSSGCELVSRCRNAVPISKLSRSRLFSSRAAACTLLSAPVSHHEVGRALPMIHCDASCSAHSDSARRTQFIAHGCGEQPRYAAHSVVEPVRDRVQVGKTSVEGLGAFCGFRPVGGAHKKRWRRACCDLNHRRRDRS